MSRKQKDFDPKRNQRFAVALNVLRQHSENQELSQKDLASKMGMNENSISRILTLQNKVTDNFISKFQTASGCIFNLQWLRGESDIMLAKDVPGQEKDNSDEKDKRIAELERELADKNELVILLHGRIDEQAARIADLTKHRDDLRMMLQQHVAKEALDKYPFSSEVAEKDVNNFREISAR